MSREKRYFGPYDSLQFIRRFYRMVDIETLDSSKGSISFCKETSDHIILTTTSCSWHEEPSSLQDKPSNTSFTTWKRRDLREFLRPLDQILLIVSDSGIVSNLGQESA